MLKDIGLKELYVGQTPIVSGEIAEDITHYFAVSEQTPSVCALGVLVNPDLTVQKAGGFLIQLLPGCPQETVEAIETAVSNLDAVTVLLGQGLSPAAIAQRAMGSLHLEKLDEYGISYRCSCTRERVEKALLSIGGDALQEMADDTQDTKVECHFCEKTYCFTPADIRGLLEKQH